MGEHLLTAGEASKRLNIHMNTLKQWRQKGFIKAIPWGPGEGKGSKYKYPESEIARLLQPKQ